MLGAQLALADPHGDPARVAAARAQRGLALDQLDLVFLEQPADAAGERRDDLLAARLHAGVVDLDSADLQPELLRRRGSRRADRPSAGPPWRGCRRSSGSARRPCPSRSPPSSCRAARRGSRRHSRPARSRSRCSHTRSQPSAPEPIEADASEPGGAVAIPVRRPGSGPSPARASRTASPPSTMLSRHTPAASSVEATTSASEVTRIWKASSASNAEHRPVAPPVHAPREQRQHAGEEHARPAASRRGC